MISLDTIPFGRRVKAFRILVDITQDELAEMAKLSTRSISLLENDKPVRPLTKAKVKNALIRRYPDPTISAFFNVSDDDATPILTKKLENGG